MGKEETFGVESLKWGKRQGAEIAARISQMNDNLRRRAVGPRPGNAGGRRPPGTGKTSGQHKPLSRFETEVLVRDENLKALSRLNAEWVGGAMVRIPHQRVILDMDSTESPVFGRQDGTAYNGHFGYLCYHPLFCFN